MGLSLRQELLRYAFQRPRAFPVIGWDGRDAWRRFCDLPWIAPSSSPHDSDLLVLSGEIPPRWQARVRALLETLPLPRAVIWLRPAWTRHAPEGVPVGRVLTVDRLAEFAGPEALLPLFDPRIRANQAQLLEPAENQPTPPKRRMARRVEDVDHLALDELPLLLGPHFPHLPPGLQLALRMQGDRIRLCEGVHNAFPIQPLAADAEHRGGPGHGPAMRVLLGEAVPVAALERARLRSHLGWMADFLALADQPDLAARVRAQMAAPELNDVRAFLPRAERALRPLLADQGRLSARKLLGAGAGGPVARASGLQIDARARDPAYRGLDFQPVVEHEGDSLARWRVRAREVLQSLELIAWAGDRLSRAAESPRGQLLRAGSQFLAPTTALFEPLKSHLAGMEWREALLFIASLDLNMEEAALQ